MVALSVVVALFAMAGAYAVSFTDTATEQHYNRLGLKSLCETIDANNQLMETGAVWNGSHIVDGSISNGDLSANAVTTDKIAAGGVTNSDLAANSVSGDKIVDATVSNADLSADCITTDKIAAGGVTNGDLAANSVSGDKIVNASVSNEDLSADCITTDKIAAGGVTNGDLAANSVTSDKIADGSVTNGDLSAALTTPGFLGVGTLFRLTGQEVTWGADCDNVTITNTTSWVYVNNAVGHTTDATVAIINGTVGDVLIIENRGAGQLVIEDNANTQLGAAAMPLKQTDIATFLYNGTDWLCVSTNGN
jgi:hypothetical protein